MTYAHQLIINLLLLRSQLHIVGERLPFATPTGSKMLTKRLQTTFRRLFYLRNKAFHVVVALFGDTNVHNIAGNREWHEYDKTVRTMGNCLAFGRHGLYSDILEDQV